MNEKAKDKVKQNEYRRPWACASLQLTYRRLVEEDSKGNAGTSSGESEHVNDLASRLIEHKMIIYNTPQELSFPEIHDSKFQSLKSRE